MQNEKVIFTGLIPQCPHCKKPTTRSTGITTVTAMYYNPTYNEEGVNINPDRNTRTERWNCFGCGKEYITAGNDADGYFYK